MILLKLKSLIYRQTGIYLAHREELEYITSKECWQQFAKMYRNGDGSLLPRGIQGLLIGLWQVDHGFHRPYNRKNEAKKLKKRMAKRIKSNK